MKQAWGIVLTVVALAAASQPAGAQGVKVALLPAAQTITPGSEFDLSMEVTRAGSRFNAFDAYIGYDPAALTLVPLDPLSLQEGSYMTGACPNRFHRFLQGTDRDTITDVLLCSGVSLPGPGQIYKLRFRASSTPQITTVRFLPGLQFYNIGLFVNPDSSSDATIGIGLPLAVGPDGSRLPRLELVVSPNPARGRVSFRIDSDRAGRQRLRVTDLQGRVIRHFDEAEAPAGVRTVTWDGRSDSGQAARPGRYTATLSTSGKTLEKRFTLLR